MRFIDLFAGIGGFRLGLEKGNKEGFLRQSDLHRYIPSFNECRKSDRETSGRNWSKESDSYFTCVWSCEIDKYCEQVYKRNFGEGFDAHDVYAVDASTIPDFDLLASGFPCQSFSIAGKRRGFADTRGTLFFEICRILRAKRPRLLLLENVKGLLSDDEGRTFHTILRSLDELGYDLQWEVLNSKNFGVPQNRERVFIVGHLRGMPGPQVFPLGEDGKAIIKEVTELTQEADQASRIYDIDGLSPTLPTPSGGRHIPKIYDVFNQRFRADQIAGALKGEGIADTSIGTALFDGMKLRRLTPLECERLQGFPDGWTEGVSDTQRYKMLGNAVTVNVVEAIGEKLMGGSDGVVG